jgi:hypothetical protein
MTHTLWRGAELLGEADLAPLPGGVPGSLHGPFRPAPAFASAWPAFAALSAAGGRVGAALAGLPRDADPHAVQAAIAGADPDDALGAAAAAVDALRLEVRDAAGRALAGLRADVALRSLSMLDDMLGDFTPEQRAEVERDAAAAGVVLGGPNYLLVVTPRRRCGAARAGASAGAI